MLTLRYHTIAKEIHNTGLPQHENEVEFGAPLESTRHVHPLALVSIIHYLSFTKMSSGKQYKAIGVSSLLHFGTKLTYRKRIGRGQIKSYVHPIPFISLRRRGDWE